MFQRRKIMVSFFLYWFATFLSTHVFLSLHRRKCERRKSLSLLSFKVFCARRFDAYSAASTRWPPWPMLSSIHCQW